MILRSAVQLQAKVIASVSTGDFIELRSDDHSAKPWLARVVGTRSSPDQLDSGIVPTEVECEWLWHPKETIAELGLVGVDPNVYGSREVFLGSGNGEATRDWNPIESKKWQVYVFPLVQYKAVAAAGFQLVAHDDSDRRYGPTVSGSKAVILDPSRCWYYRQAVDTDKRTLFPDLERTIHCPNPAFLQWCRLANTKPDQPTPLHLPPDATDPPPRTLCVPENPECVYFFCTDCSRRFETRQGDCVDSAAPFFLEDARPTIRFKSHINQADVAFRCPMCVTAASAVSFQTDRPESSVALEPNAQAAAQDQVDVSREEKRKLTRYGRFKDVFKRAIEECKASNIDHLTFTDSNVLCDIFFEHFEEYATQEQLSAKMAHQRMHEMFQNLKRENNTDLRRRIVCGELPIKELVRLDAKELAPAFLKRRREIEAQKYFKQQVLLASSPTGPKLIRKTHKGLEAVADESDDSFHLHSLPGIGQDEEQASSSSPLTETTPGSSAATSGVGFDALIRSDASTTLATIQAVEQRLASLYKQPGSADARWFELPSPVQPLWDRSMAAKKGVQLECPPNFCGIPTSSETAELLSAHLSCCTNGDNSAVDTRRCAPFDAFWKPETPMETD